MAGPEAPLATVWRGAPEITGEPAQQSQVVSDGGWSRAARVYGDRRVLSMLFLGFSSGLPFGVLAEPLTAWLTGAG